MANAHPFNFLGGLELSRMGATWFVSYAYYKHIDSNHDNWNRVKTSYNRANLFHSTTRYHEFWLQQILLMDIGRLNTNTIGIDGYDTKRMAREILNSFSSKKY